MNNVYILRSEHSHIPDQWVIGTDYDYDKLIYNDGATYACRAPHVSGATDEPGTGANYLTYWAPVALGADGVPGPTGATGGVTAMQDWITGTLYAPGDIVSHAWTGYGTSRFICKEGQGHTSDASSEPVVGGSWETYWELFVKGGQNGAGTGDVVGPASSVLNDLAGFADVSGKLLKSLGAFATNLLAQLTAIAASTATPAGTDIIITSEGGTWKTKTVNNFAKKKIPVIVRASGINARLTDGCAAAAAVEMATNKQVIYALSFIHTAKKYANFSFELPAAYDGGTITAYVTWYSTGTTSNSVRFGVQGRAYGDNESWDQALGTAVEVTDTATGTALRRLKTAVMSAITLAGTPAGGETCVMQIYRDPTHGDDNLDESVFVTAVKLEIGVNAYSES